MGRLDSPTQDPTTVDFFKIHEVTFDPKTGLWANDVLVNNKNVWKVQIPSDLKAGDYIIRHEIVALHYAARENAGPEFLISCANVRVLGDGTAVPKDTVRFPGAYQLDNSGLKINIYHHENRYVSCISPATAYLLRCNLAHLIPHPTN
jgi:lytic cellulose monooxygenase (C1-hydroxylating)